MKYFVLNIAISDTGRTAKCSDTYMKIIALKKRKGLHSEEMQWTPSSIFSSLVVFMNSFFFNFSHFFFTFSYY